MQSPNMGGSGDEPFVVSPSFSVDSNPGDMDPHSPYNSMLGWDGHAYGEDAEDLYNIGNGSDEGSSNFGGGSISEELMVDASNDETVAPTGGGIAATLSGDTAIGGAAKRPAVVAFEPLFKVGDTVHAEIPGLNARKVTALITCIGGPENFFNNGRYQIKYQVKKKGAIHKMVDESFWAKPVMISAIEGADDDHAAAKQQRTEKEPATSAGGANQVDGPDLSALEQFGEKPEMAKHNRPRVIPKMSSLTKGANQTTASAPRRSLIGNKKASGGLGAKVTAEMRMTEFPFQSFTSFEGVLFCDSCKAKVDLKKSTIDVHVSSKKHGEKLALYDEKKVSDADKRETLLTYFKENPDNKFSTVDIDVHTKRYNVVETLLYAGIPLAKIDDLRQLLERAGCGMSHSRNMAIYIPRILEAEQKLLKEEVCGQWVSHTFDGTSRLGEVLNIVSRWCGEEFTLVQRLTYAKTIKKHLTGQGLAAVVAEHSMATLAIPVKKTVAFVRDSVATNGKAVRLLKDGLFPASVDMKCEPHTIMNLGENVELPTITVFMSVWIKFVYDSPPVKALWKLLIGEAVQGFSNVRWYSKYEILVQIGKHWDKLVEFMKLCNEREHGDALREKLNTIFGAFH